MWRGALVLILTLGMTEVAPAQGKGAAPSSAYLPGLAYARQTYNNCGPAALSSVLGYYKLHVGQDVLRQYLRPAGGYMTADVIDPFVRQFGLRATRFANGNVGAVRRLVGAGIPVIVLQWLGRPGDVPHFRVVRGYDDAAGVLWVADSMIAENAYVSYADFDTLWNVQGRLMIPVYPAGDEARVRRLVGL